MSVEVEGLSLTETAALYGVSKGWVSKLVGRYRTEGEAAFEPRSRRPHSSPSRVAEVVNETIVNLRVDLAERGLDAGPETIQWHLAQAGHDVSVSTIRRRLIAAGLVTPEPKKRPRTSYIRFEAELPNECWQSDFTHYFLTDGTDTEVLVWLDDHSRYALSVTAHLRVTGPLVVDTFNRTGATQGFPASTLTDNGLVYTARFAGGKGGRNAFETRLNELKIVQKNSQPNHPTTCGKVERFHQTLKKWLTAQHPQPHTLDQLQAMIDAFVDEYNHRRPHRSLGRTTPAVAYRRLPRTGPAGSNTGPHYPIRHDRIDKTGAVSLRRAGRMHHISIGRAHTGTAVILLIDDL
ncbi:MAG: IS481 family transposase, partial [Candidatus Microthrix sp.]|nr:IS481 family transposase [Candidatus Microthrix sp.]